MGQVTTSVCRVSALVLCAGLGVALTGAGGTAFIAAMAGSAFGGAAGNFFHQVTDGVVSWFGKKKFDTTTLPANHDLDGLTACAIHHVFALARDRLSTDDPMRGVLERLAKMPLSTIVAVMQAQDTRVVDDAVIVGTLGTPSGGQTTTVSTPKLWQSFVGDLLKMTGADRQPSALNLPVRDLNQLVALAAHAIKDATRKNFRWNVIPPDADLAARAKDPAADDAAAFAAGLLHANVAAFANDILRETFGPQGRFFVAALFSMLNTISANTKQPPPGAKFTDEQIAQIKACLPDAVNAAIAQSRELPAPADAESLAACREMQEQASALATTLQGMNAKLDVVQKTLHDFAVEQRETLARIEGKLDAAVANSAEARDAAVRVEKMLAGTVSAATLKSANNLAAAKVAPNQFFTGRTDELARLHAALAGGSVAIVHALTGEGGIGKTELAKVYALIYADTYDSAWWLDASAAALRGELVKVYERATGKQAPQNAQTDDLRQALVDHWQGKRPLIILDNVDDPANFTLFSAAPTARILATTRQHYKTLQGVEPFALGVLPIADAVALMRKEIAKHRADVTDADLTAIATELGGHALAVALAGAYLAEYAAFSAGEVLAKLQASKAGDIDEPNEQGEHDIPGQAYRKSVSASLSLSFSHADVEPALALLAAASFLHPTGITIEWLMAGTGWDKSKAVKAAAKLERFSILKSMPRSANAPAEYTIHRLTQGVARTRPEVVGGTQSEATLSRLLDALIALFRWPDKQAEQLLDHTKTRARLAAVAHAEAVIVYAEMRGRKAGKGAAAPLPRTTALLNGEVADELSAQAAHLRAQMANRLTTAGQIADAARHINAAIDWFEAQSPRDESNLAVRYASRAMIRQCLEDLVGAESDIKKSLDWEEAQPARDDSSLAVLYASRASIRQDRGDLAGAEADINKSIRWEESQTQPNQRELAVRYGVRASIRKDLDNLAGAEADIQKSINWGEAQSPRDERGLAVDYTSRARILRNQALAARKAGDAKAAAALFAKAQTDIAAALTWWEQNLPHDERTMGILRRDQALIEKVAKG